MKKILPPLLIFILIILAYANTLRNKFAYDDISVIVENQSITSLKSIENLFNKHYFQDSGEKSYRPIVTLSYFIDYAIWHKNPFGYHLTNLLLHIFTSFAVLLLASNFICDSVILTIGTLIFGCHPLLTEAICSITFREDILSTLFFVIAFWGYISFRKTEYLIWFIIILPAYFLSLLSKEMGLAFIPALIVYEIFTLRKPKTIFKFLYIICCIGIVTVVFLLLRFSLLYNPTDEYDKLPFTINTAFKILLTYWQLYFFPIKLRALYYSRELFNHWREIILCIIAFIVGIGQFCLLDKDKKKTALLLLSLSGILFTPVLNIYPIRHIIAERYAYLPATIFSYFLAILFTPIIKTKYRKIVVTLSLCICLLFTSRAMVRNSIWKHNLSLWFYTAKHNPWLAEAYFSLGHAYQMRSRYSDAIKCYVKSLKDNPDYSDSYINMGRICVEQGNYKRAINYYNIALSYQPNNPMLHYNIGIAYYDEKIDKKTLAHLERCIELEPNYYQAYNLLGSYYVQHNDQQKAEYYWRKAIDINPRYKEAYVNVGSLYANTGHYDEARIFWQKALKIDPDYEKPKKHLQYLDKTLKMRH